MERRRRSMKRFLPLVVMAVLVQPAGCHESSKPAPDAGDDEEPDAPPDEYVQECQSCFVDVPCTFTSVCLDSGTLVPCVQETRRNVPGPYGVTCCEGSVCSDGEPAACAAGETCHERFEGTAENRTSSEARCMVPADAGTDGDDGGWAVPGSYLAGCR
jgi:hypothetical protein